MVRWLLTLVFAAAAQSASAADKAIEFFWKPYAHAAEVASLELKVKDAAGQVVKTASVPPGNVTLQLALADGALYQAALTAVSIAGEPRSESAATTVDLRTQPPPPPTKLPAPEGFGWRLVDPTPPPPPAGGAFMQNIVLRDATGYRLTTGQSKVFAADPKYSVYAKSWGVSLKYRCEAAPSQWSILSFWSGANPQWMLQGTGETRVMATFGKSNASYDGFDIPGVDSVVGRMVHVVIGYDAATKKATIWIDGVARGTKTLDANVGWTENNIPSLILNSTEAGHASGDLTVGELVYAVGAAPTQADVDVLYGAPVVEPGFQVSASGTTVKVEAFGEGFADKPHEDPKAWVDGAAVKLTKVRSNPPRELRYEGPIPEIVGSGTVPLRAEWRWNNKRPPDAVKEATTSFTRTYTFKPAAPPQATNGVSHIRRDGSIGFDLKEDSEIYIGSYGFTPAEFGDTRWGLKVRDEMLAANFGVEGGSILHYDPTQAVNFDEWWLKTGDFRRVNAIGFERWAGPWSVPDDDMTWGVGVNLKAWMEQPTFEADVKRWCDWRNSFPGCQRPRFVITKDEANLAFGGDPTNASHPNLKDILPLGGMSRVTKALRQGGQPVAPGLFGVDDTVPVGYTKWTLPEYSDFVAQYYQPNLLVSPWTGQSLRHQAIQMKWAAKHRDPARPLSLNFGLIVGYWIPDGQGGWEKQIPSNDPKTIPAQLWVAVSYGGVALRGYAMTTHDFREFPTDPAATEYQQGLKPGEPAYYAMLTSATMIKDNTRRLLGAEQPVPDAGPDFVCGHRQDPIAGRIWWAVNLSEVDRVVPAAAVPSFDWKTRETLTADGVRRQIADVTDLTVPANGVLVLKD